MAVSRVPFSTILYAALPHLAWGFLVLFWTELRQIPAIEIVVQRVVWSVVFLSPLLLYAKHRAEFRRLLKNRQELLYIVASAAMIGINWGIFVTAMISGRILESSLGYFLAPLFSVLIGVLLLGERLNRPQKLSLCLAGVAVVLFISKVDRFPTLAFGMSSTFALYGYFKTKTRVKGEFGIFIEALLLMPILLVLGPRPWPPYPTSTFLLLAATGPITAVPLIWYAQSLQRVPLSMVAFLQYLSPIIQFLLALAYYREPFDLYKGIAFAFIWAAVSLFLWDAMRRTSH